MTGPTPTTTEQDTNEHDTDPTTNATDTGSAANESNTNAPMNATDTSRQTEDRAASNRKEPTRTMSEVSHTNPQTGKPFGESQAYTRGRLIVADGGNAEAEQDGEADDTARVRDVDHTPRENAPDASTVYERGGEGDAEAADDGGEE